MASIIYEKLTFGIELELLLRPKDKVLSSLIKKGWDARQVLREWTEWNNMWKKIAEMRDATARAKAEESQAYVAALHLVQGHRRMFHEAMRDVMVGNNIPTGLATSNYDTWTIVDDTSITEHPGYWRIELVSKKLHVAEDWQGQLDAVFTLLAKNCDVRLSTDCSMHIHVSPGPTSNDTYQVPQLKNILKAIAVFDVAITSIVPADRKANPYAESNFAPLREPGHLARAKVEPKLLAAFADVPQHGWAPVFKQFDVLKNVHVNFIHSLFFNNRYMSWNFANLASECGTIEFRRPPGFQDAATAKHWVAFTLALIANAIAVDWNKAKYETHGTVDQLARFVAAGEKRLPRTCRALNDNLIRPNHAPATKYSKEEMLTINRKKEAKKNKISSFVAKINSRPNSPN